MSLRPVSGESLQMLVGFCHRHGNDQLASRLENGDLQALLRRSEAGEELRIVPRALAERAQAWAHAPDSLGEFWGTWSGDEWSPSLEAATRIGARTAADRVILNEQAAGLFLYGRDILGGSVVHHDERLKRGDVAWVTDRDQNVLGLGRVVDRWETRGVVLEPLIDLGWYLREGG